MKKALLVIVPLIIIGIVVAIMTKFSTTPPSLQQEVHLSGDIFTGETINSGATDTLSGNTITNSGTIQPVTGTTNTQSNNPLVYTNTEFGFQLTLPEGWEGYKAFVYHLTEDDIIANISITLPTTIKNWPGVPNPKITHSLLGMQDFSTYITGYANIINILVRSSDPYKQIVKNCKLGTEEECLTKNLTLGNNSYYFTYTTRQELPTDVMNRIKLYPNWVEIIKSSFQSF